MVNEMTSEPTPGALLAGIRETRLVAIVRGTDGGAAAQAALAAMAEGFRYVEIALTTRTRSPPSARSAPRPPRAASSGPAPS